MQSRVFLPLVLSFALALTVVPQTSPALHESPLMRPEQGHSFIPPARYQVESDDASLLALTHALSLPADIVVHAGGNLQAAINSAVAGDTITLDAGAEFVGTFSLPNKAGSSYITIRSSALSNLPAGVRVSPASVVHMATIRTNSPNGPAVFTQTAAHHYRFQGIEFETTTGVSSDGGIVRLGSNPRETSLSQITHDFDFDRCYIHGQPTQNVQQGIVLEAQDATVQNSYISDIHYVGTDSQAILTITSPGGLHIINNYLEAAGENFLAGGADPKIAGLVPGMTGGIEIRRNYFFKPLSWKVGHPSYAGIHWTVKNSLELKNSKDTLIDGNVFENCWNDGQVGIAILFTVRNQENTAPWSTVENTTFTNNWVKNVTGGINFLGWDNEGAPGQRATGAVVANNLFTGMGSQPWVQINGFYNVTLDHNTFFQTANILLFYVENSTGFVMKNNMTIYSGFGIVGFGSDGASIFGTQVFAVNAPGGSFLNNVIVGAQQNPNGFTYSTAGNNSYPASVSTVQFVDFAGGNFSLQPTSPFRNAGTDGKDIGYDKAALDAAIANTVSGGGTTVCRWNTTPACRAQ